MSKFSIMTTYTVPGVNSYVVDGGKSIKSGFKFI